MQPSQERCSAVVIRRARAEDYGSYARLFPELSTGDAVPSRHQWESSIAPSTWVAELGGRVVGYCYTQVFGDTGYVRNVVTAPDARRRGVARALLGATRQQLRGEGQRLWRLNVRPSSAAAIALYEQLGLRERYRSQVLRLPWSVLPALPTGCFEAESFGCDQDAALEALFDLPAGQLASARAAQRILLRAVAPGGEPIGLAVFSPEFPGAFPFRVLPLEAASALLAAMRAHALEDEIVNLVVEDDARLAELLLGAGAALKEDMLHMTGAL